MKGGERGEGGGRMSGESIFYGVCTIFIAARNRIAHNPSETAIVGHGTMWAIKG